MESVTKQIRKSLKIKESGRSSDFITPSFGWGCLLDCAYCYMKRHKPDKHVSIASNTDQILTTIDQHLTSLPKKQPNQTHPWLWTYDISCNEDFALHSKYHDWKTIFDYFRDSPRAMATLATKIVPTRFLDYKPRKKIRIRFSLMPQEYSTLLEPNTPSIQERIDAINQFKSVGYSVHINFSPVIITEGWRNAYKELFHQVNEGVATVYKSEVLAEVIFLTHNQKKHKHNLQRLQSVQSVQSEELLWKPELQESKVSQYGGKNIRYQWQLKQKAISHWKEWHDEIIPWNKIRYIF